MQAGIGRISVEPGCVAEGRHPVVIVPLPNGRYAVVYSDHYGKPVRLIVSSAEEAERMEAAEKQLAARRESVARALRLTRGDEAPEVKR